MTKILSYVRVVSDAEHAENVRELEEYCKGNFTAMYNFMRHIKSERYMATHDERYRIVDFVRKSKYVSKKKLVDFIMGPDKQKIRMMQRNVPKMKVMKRG